MSKAKHSRGIFKRFEGNPILRPEEWPYPVNAVFNPGAVEFNGETLLLVRVESMEGFSHFTVARSKNGETDWTIDPEPTFLPDPDNYPEEINGIEDPRIVMLEGRNEYAIAYTGYSQSGPLVSMATTRDFQEFERYGVLLPIDNKDASLFPRPFGGRWAMIHRPMPADPSTKANIWISFSPDLKHWGDHSVLLKTRDGGWWDACKIGLGTQPVETEEGWLLIYHGVRETASGSIYRVGLALLDLEDPQKVIRRGREWVLGPQEDYERVGDVSDVTFPTGAVLDEEKGTLRLYYGAADTCIGLATAKVNDILSYIEETGE